MNKNEIQENTNIIVNNIFYDFENMRKERNILLCKIFLGKSIEKDWIRLKALNIILEYHKQGKRINKLMSINGQI